MKKEKPEGISRRDAIRMLFTAGAAAGAAPLAACYHRPGKRKLWSGVIDGKFVEYFSNDPSFGRSSYISREDDVLVIYRDRTGRDPEVEFFDANGSGVIGDHKKDKVIVYGRIGYASVGPFNFKRYHQDVYSRDRFKDSEGHLYTADQNDPVNQAMMNNVARTLEAFTKDYQRYREIIQKEAATRLDR